MRRLINYLNNHFKHWKDFYIGEDENDWSLRDMRLAYMVSELFNMAVYDDGLSVEIGNDILEIMKVIIEEKNFDYINKGEEYYKQFIILANLLIDCRMLEWGTSIRGCWFACDTFIKFPGLNVEFKIKERDDYLQLIRWFDGEEIEIDED